MNLTQAIRLKVAASALAAVPVLAYTGVAVAGLGAGLGFHALRYLLLVAPLVALVVLAWLRPRPGGLSLAVASVALAVLLLLDVEARYVSSEGATIVVSLCLPPFLAGILFSLSAPEALSRRAQAS